MMITTRKKEARQKGVFHALRLVYTEYFEASTPHMDAVFSDWLANIEPRVKPTTYSTYRFVIQRHISPALGAVPAPRLTDADISGFMTMICAESSGLSDATVRMIACVLRSALEFAQRRGVDVSPELCCVPKKQARPNIPVLTEEERTKLLAQLGPCPEGKDLGVLLSLKTGLRVGEVCALKWGDISFGEGALYVRRTVQRITTVDGSTRLYFGDPKSADSRREVPLSPSMRKVLQARRRAEDVYVVSGHTDRTVEPRTMQRHFKTVLRRAGIRDLNFHALRHTFATRCIERGFDVKSLSMVMGHADVKTTLNIYVHPSSERLREMMAVAD